MSSTRVCIVNVSSNTDTTQDLISSPESQSPPRLKKKRGKGKKRKKKEILTAFRLQHIFFYAHKKTVKNPMNTHPENDEEADRREGWWEEEQARLIAEGKRPPIDPTYVPPPRTLLCLQVLQIAKQIFSTDSTCIKPKQIISSAI